MRVGALLLALLVVATASLVVVVAALGSCSSQEFRGDRSAQVEANTADGEDVLLRIDLEVSVPAGQLPRLEQDVGPQWYERLVEPRVRSFTREAIVVIEGADLGAAVPEVAEGVLARLKVDLAPYSIAVESLTITLEPGSPTR